MGKSIIARITVIFVFTFLLFNFAFAEIPRLIQYQGKAMDKSSGLPLTGNHNVTFRLYDSATTGTKQWEESHSNVPVSNGNFSVLLGSDDPVANPLNLPFDKPYWLSVEINNDGEMSPRERLASVPYAYTAAKANHANEATHANSADTFTQSPIPSGVIVMWSGSIATIPQGWALCDGTNGTPDLRDRFIVGASQDDGGIAKTNVKETLLQTGGEHEHTLTVQEMPSHSHTMPGGYRWYDGDQGQSYSLKGGGSISTNSTGGGQAHENCPPFYALAFITKL